MVTYCTCCEPDSGGNHAPDCPNMNINYGITTRNAAQGYCPYCSTPYSFIVHGGHCPKVKAIEYYPNGTVKRIEFHPEYIVLIGQTGSGRVIPVHAIKELTWEPS